MKDLMYLLIFLAGLISGIILAIGVRYPFEISELQRAEKVCKDQKVYKLKIGITGSIYEVTCEDKITYVIKN